MPETDKPWIAWGICIYEDCPDHYVGDMEWRRDIDGNDYAVCPSCDREIASEVMPNSREDRELKLGF